MRLHVSFVSQVLVEFAIFFFWELAVRLANPPPYILPTPHSVLVAFKENSMLIYEHSLVTIVEVLIGLTIGIILGMITALTLEIFVTARLILRPLLIFSQSIPVFAIAPLLTLWLGYGILSNSAGNLEIKSGNTTALSMTGANVAAQGNLSVAGSQVDFTALPTSDPGVAGRLWRDGTTVKISV